jgi:hypothetical protein
MANANITRRTNKMQMSDSEIRRRHKEGATVQILADLNAVPSSTIKSILENKPIPATPKKKYEHRSAEYKKLYDEGKGDSEIGELMGTRASNVWSWRKANKLPSNVAPKRKKEDKQMNTKHEPKVATEPLPKPPKPSEEHVEVVINADETFFGGKLYCDYDADSSMLTNSMPTLPESISKYLPYTYSVILENVREYAIEEKRELINGKMVLVNATIKHLYHK